MTKELSIRASHTQVQKYWKDIAKKLQKGDIDPTFMITHDLSFEKAAEAYKMFDDKQDDAVKIVLRPDANKYV